MRLVKGRSGQCGGCWRFWSQCNDSSYVHQQTRPSQHHQGGAYTANWQDWQNQQWSDSGPWVSGRTKSPRKRTQSPRQRVRKQPHNQVKGEVNKGKGRGAAMGFAGPPSTTWLAPPSLPASMMPASPETSTVSAPSTTMPSMTPFPKPSFSKDEQELQSLRHLYKEIKNKANLPEDIKKAVLATEATVRKVYAKTHSQLVSQLNTMRKKLAEIDEQWESYRQQWADYLDKASQMWISHVEEFEQGETQFAERRGEALRNLQTTREALHDAHQRTMGQDVLATNDIDSAQEALDATMTGRKRFYRDAVQLRADQGEPQWCGDAGSQHHRRQNQEESSIQIAWKASRRIPRFPRSRSVGTDRQESSGFQLAPCLLASSHEVIPGCATSGRRDTGREIGRFCKVAFWPVVDYEGAVNEESTTFCNFWSDSDDLSEERACFPFPFHHSVMEEPDFHSVWEARDSALLLQEALRSSAFDVQFDTVQKKMVYCYQQ